MKEPSPTHEVHNGHQRDAGQPSELERVRWHVRNAYGAVARGDAEAALVLLGDADRLLVELADDELGEAA